MGELLDALGHASATFARSVPGIGARETLTQRGRRGLMEMGAEGRDGVKYTDFRIPRDFHTHQIVSIYSFGQIGTPPVLHEVRTVVTLDNIPIHDEAAVRHALSIGMKSADDETKKKMLEDLEHSRLTGAVTDFGQVLLLFAPARQNHYKFAFKGQRSLGSEAFFILHYRQISGAEGLTEFRDRTEERHLPEGEIWLRQKDLLPLRITLNTTEALSSKYTLRNEGEVNYQPSSFGLVPATVAHRQYLNKDLLVENNFSYSDYHGRTATP
jgi:hypothetical protein